MTRKKASDRQNYQLRLGRGGRETRGIAVLFTFACFFASIAFIGSQSSSASPRNPEIDLSSSSPGGIAGNASVLDPNTWRVGLGGVGINRLSAAVLNKRRQRGPILPLWTGSDDGFSYTVVGTDPFLPEGRKQVTNLKAEIFPVIVTMADTGDVFDPTKSNESCSPSGSPLNLTTASPIFQPVSLAPGATGVGTGEYPTDLFQRANFYEQTSGPNAINPDYGVTLDVVQGPSVDVTVAPQWGETARVGCDGLALIDGFAWDQQLQSALSTSFRQVVNPKVLPIFLLSNVAFYSGSPDNCCVLGYHSATVIKGEERSPQTYIVADYDTSALFAGISDIGPLSDEVASWMDDPFDDNPTPPWEGADETAVECYDNLEVGSPLVGTDFPVTMPNGFTYHLQDLAFTSWFYGDSPSLGVNGWYSFDGNFKTAAPPCM